MVIDEYKNPVSNASIRIKIKDTNISAKTFSDNNGLFTLEFLTPEKEGNYSLILSAEKHPFLSFNSSFELKVIKSKEISIVFPDTVRVARGENLIQKFSLINTGQAEILNLNLSLTGISSEYYSLVPEIEKLDVGEEKILSINFSVPLNASIGTSSVKLKIFNEEISKEKTFGFTVTEKNQTSETKHPTTGLFSKIVLPRISLDPSIYILIFAAIAFSLSFSLKRRKIKNQDRSRVKNLLLDLKEYLKSREDLAHHKTIQKVEEVKKEEKAE
jgi:hypothetical protein